MNKNFIFRIAVAATGLLLSFTASALVVDGVELQKAGNKVSDQASLQRGAKLYMNYCSGCHSLKYMRYSRMAEDLNMVYTESNAPSKEELDASRDAFMQSMVYSGAQPGEAKFGDHMITSLSADEGTQWFGKAPPDLSLTVRSKVGGSDWVYTYLKTFYMDPESAVGWNNQLFPNASMPYPLWDLQGVQVPEYDEPNASGDRPILGFTLTQPGRLSAEEFNAAARDITNFLEYASEPAALKRQNLGIWVFLFLILFTFVAYLLKKEYWKDVEH